eukprot:jgi/Tetstr1/453110/TSEL_040133.t1
MQRSAFLAPQGVSDWGRGAGGSSPLSAVAAAPASVQQYALRSAAALTSAARVASRCERHVTTQRRRGILREFEAWASTVPPPLTPTPETCTEWDVLIFFAEYWHRHHHGRKLMRDGSQPASPRYLRHVVSQLATALRELGVPKHANPVYAVSVVKYMGGYKRALVELGYVESGAVPLDYANLAELVQFMDGLILRTTADLVVTAAVHRDVCIVLYLWETAARGFEAGTMELTDFLVRGVDLRPAWDAIVAGRLTADDRVLAEPRYGTKGNLTAHSGVMELELLPPGSESLCLIRRLGRCAADWECAEHCPPACRPIWED